MDVSWEDSRRGFGHAARWFEHMVGHVGDRWDQSGLGEWDIRALVGHTSRSLLTVETYLGRPAEAVEVSSSTDYYRATSQIAKTPAVAERGRDAGQALGSDPPTAVAEIVARVVPLLDSCDGTELVTTIAGGMRLGDYLPTRTCELVVHSADLATAVGHPLDVPADAAAQTLQLINRLAVAGGLAGPLLLAATGRQGLPPGFSVL